MNRPWIIGIMGGGDAAAEALDNAYRLGCLVAQHKWCLLNGGRDAGVMAASARGAFENGGLTVGILPGTTLHTASPHITIPIRTGMGMARNCINVLSSDVVVACPGGPGTLSEIALALKSDRPVITMGFSLPALPGLSIGTGRLLSADTPEAVVGLIEKLLQ
ncbi:TIGR00725 family protein [Desulfosudis oleivorans]|uniref:Rossmann fold nucleotide-binding protein n=1 Tax=Desulfosudis oleivorans (strain DSM 6200 / JCM 39069 / Hxd3) TaxID=96561 RepID=A8ZUB7_DESOH|nr:TIGR00725 family protein [Desulfosudis oleivorans]ABW67949.1 Rossmann fold nucleotide-binding protein [Desulfosudis oleivorans Hxd3]